ncbi:cation efflux protein [Globomyces pollinis-pini]|nr:cation efflux protein [Globomyces pollinis-pini]
MNSHQSPIQIESHPILLFFFSHMPNKQLKIQCMIVLSFIFFTLELVCGYSAGSIALIADSFHMLSDVISLFIALYAAKLAKSKLAGPEYSFGLQRAEVLGALINGVSLLALSATLIIEAIQRFFKPEEIENPWTVFYVASAGLIVNLLGMSLFHEHSHAHGHHGHGHDSYVALEEGDNESDTGLEIENPINLNDAVVMAATLMQSEQLARESATEQTQLISSHNHQDYSSVVEVEPVACSHGHNHDHGHSHQHAHQENHNHDNHAHDGHGHSHAHHDMNMHGVFLHILGDLLASLGVIVSALIMIYVEGSWTTYVDPAISLVITLIIIKSTVPLVKSASYILLQATPRAVSVEKLRRDILKIKGVLGVHELHVWQLSDNQTIASVHVIVPKAKEEPVDGDQYMKLAAAIKDRLHSHGIHSTTVQPEFVSDIKDDDSVSDFIYLMMV